MHPTVTKLRDRLRELGLEIEVHELDRSTRTAADAAAAVGVEVGQIVKSLVFAADDRPPFLVLCAGDRRVDTRLLGNGVRTATADQVREASGFAIGGGPPPRPHPTPDTIVDESLRRFE